MCDWRATLCHFDCNYHTFCEARRLNFDPFKPYNEKDEQLVQILGASIHLITELEGWLARSAALIHIDSWPPCNAMISFTERLSPEPGSDPLPAHRSHCCCPCNINSQWKCRRAGQARYIYNYTTPRGWVAIIECPARDWFLSRRKPYVQ